MFEADTLVACPGPETGATVLQGLCDTHITFAPTARRRRGEITAASEKKRLKIKGSRQEIHRALLVAEVADTGRTLEVFSQLAREKGAGEVVPLAIGHTPGIARPAGMLYLGGSDGRTDLAGIAQHLALSQRRVQQLIKEEILPAPERRQYDLHKSARAYIRYLQTNRQEGSRSYTEEKTRLTKEQADECELKNELMRGQLIPADQVREVWAGHIIAAKTKLLGLPAKLGPEIATMVQLPEIQAYLRRHLNEILNDLAASQVEE
jgi:phage terminase Nu1 subunit (DNA packaging protein)